MPSEPVIVYRGPTSFPIRYPDCNFTCFHLCYGEEQCVSRLCPTYCRRRMLANTIPCFITQDYPAFRREAIDRIGGWTMTRRGDFGQQLIARQTALEAPGDPCRLDSPSWIFRSSKRKRPECLNARRNIARTAKIAEWKCYTGLISMRADDAISPLGLASVCRCFSCDIVFMLGSRRKFRIACWKFFKNEEPQHCNSVRNCISIAPGSICPMASESCSMADRSQKGSADANLPLLPSHRFQ